MSSEKDLPSQGREAPAYMEYPASIMARMPYRQMTLAERGLLYTLRNECWVNTHMPSDPDKLARILGYSTEEIRSALSSNLMEFFEIQGETFFCPELEKYRCYQEARRRRMSEGGKRGSESKKKSKQGAHVENNSLSSLQPPSSHLATTLQPLRQDKPKPEKQKPAIRVSDSQEAWIKDYERVETTAHDYARLSRGG